MKSAWLSVVWLTDTLITDVMYSDTLWRHRFSWPFLSMCQSRFGAVSIVEIIKFKHESNSPFLDGRKVTFEWWKGHSVPRAINCTYIYSIARSLQSSYKLYIDLLCVSLPWQLRHSELKINVKQTKGKEFRRL